MSPNLVDGTLTLSCLRFNQKCTYPAPESFSRWDYPRLSTHSRCQACHGLSVRGIVASLGAENLYLELAHVKNNVGRQLFVEQPQHHGSRRLVLHRHPGLDASWLDENVTVMACTVLGSKSSAKYSYYCLASGRATTAARQLRRMNY